MDASHWSPYESGIADFCSIVPGPIYCEKLEDNRLTVSNFEENGTILRSKRDQLELIFFGKSWKVQ